MRLVIALAVIILLLGFGIWYVYWYAPNADTGIIDSNAKATIDWSWGDTPPVPDEYPDPVVQPNTDFKFISYIIGSNKDGTMTFHTHSNLYSTINITGYSYANFATDMKPHDVLISGIKLSRSPVPWGQTVKETFKNPITFSFEVPFTPNAPVDNPKSDLQVYVVAA